MGLSYFNLISMEKAISIVQFDFQKRGETRVSLYPFTSYNSSLQVRQILPLIGK